MMYRIRSNIGWIAGVAICLALAGCTSSPSEKKALTKPVSTPIPPAADTIEKPVNVSFSTYSKDWPVGWQWLDPDEDRTPTRKSTKNKVLSVTIPKGKDLSPGNLSAPRYIKPIKGDFSIETRVRFLPKENYQGAGLLIYQSDENFVRFERAYGGSSGGADGLRITARRGEEYGTVLTTEDAPTEAPEVDLKLIRMGRTFAAYWRTGEDAEWREVGIFEAEFPEVIYTGLIACNTASEITAEFAHIRLLPAEEK